MTVKVLFLHKCFIQSGGVERVHQNLAIALKQVNVDAMFYVMNGHYDSQKGFDALSERFNAIRCEGKRSLLQHLKNIKRIVSENNITVMISATEQANLVAFLSKLLMPRLRVVYTRHCAFDVSDQRLPPFAIKALYSLFSTNGHIVAVSEALKRQIKQSMVFNKDKVHFIPNAVIHDDIYERANDPEVTRFAEPYFIAVGRLVEQKGFDILLPAYAQALAKDKTLPILVILGEGEGREALETQAGELRLSDKVVFAGFTTNPYAPIKHACCFILSSRHEGMPTALIESLALGTPAIAFDCPTGPAEIINHGENGLLVEHLNMQALADAMLEHSTLAKDSFEAGVEHFTFSNVASDYLNLCRANAHE